MKGEGFTDEDLKRAKDAIGGLRDYHAVMNTVGLHKALIARLEAAEECAGQLEWHNEALGCIQDGSSLERLHKRALEKLEAWRKACGK
jgi:hypothetical protein